MIAMLNEALLLTRLRSRISIEQQVQVTDGAGGFTRSWQNVAQVWAHIAPLRGNESLFGNQLTSIVTHRITIRHRTGITAAMRVVYGARNFVIRAVLNPDEKNEQLVLLCEEGGAT